MFPVLKEMFNNDILTIDSKMSKDIIGNAIVNTVLSISCKKKSKGSSIQINKPCSCYKWGMNKNTCDNIRAIKIRDGKIFCDKFTEEIKNIKFDPQYIDAICNAAQGQGSILNSNQSYNILTHIDCPPIDEIEDKFANVDLQKEFINSIHNQIDSKLNENNAHIIKNMFDNDKNANIVNDISTTVKTTAYVNIKNIVEVSQKMITECGGIIDHAIQSAYIDSTINTLSGYNADGTTNSNTPPNDIKDNINKLSKELEIILGKVKQQQQQNNTKKIIIFSGIGIVIVIIIIMAMLLL